MNTKSIALMVVGLVCLGLAMPAAQAQGPCSLQTFTGTYAIYENGSSAVLDPNSHPYPYHWAGAIAPFVTVGEVTMGDGGVGEGFYWIRTGSLNGGADPIPVEVTITELNEDCTGKFSYLVNLGGDPEPTAIVERFILFDNGREFRSVPASISQNGITTLAWLGEGHRISKPGEPLYTCGPQSANGSYLISAENLVRFPTTPILSDAVLLRLNVSMNGEVTGMLYEKFGPTGNIQLPVWGTFSVDSDCSFASTLNTIIQGAPATIPIRGVFFEQGKKLYGLNVNANPVGTQFSSGVGQRIGP
jgi:hypothetical protein